MNEIDHTSMQAEACRLIGIDPNMLAGRDALHFGSVLSSLLERIVQLHKLGPYSAAAFDGPGSPELITENDDSLSFCGEFTTLGGEVDWTVPVKLLLDRAADSVHYELAIGCALDKWQSMTESKKWELTYLMCRGEDQGSWEWSYEVEGTLKRGADGT